MELGFAKSDITPRVGVELCGFGPFLNRHSKAIRERLWARAMVVRANGRIAVVIACDLIGVTRQTTERVRALLRERHGLAPESVMICCSHTHSGPAPGCYIGWGEADPPYLATLPHRIAQAATRAMENLQAATLRHAEVPCEGIGLNREYDRDAPPLEDVLRDDWRPEKPELTDTTCHVLAAHGEQGQLIGFVSYFGCHPVVCCSANRHIHGDYAGVATNLIEREHGGVVGLFLQGAQGDVNSCVVHKGEQESLLALDVIASRYARSIRHGILEAEPIEVAEVSGFRQEVAFSRKAWGESELRERLEESERIIEAEGAESGWDDGERERRMHMVYAIALRGLLGRLGRGGSLEPPTEVHGMRLGPIALLGSPFETFQPIKNEVVAAASAPIPLVVGLVNDSVGYAPDHTAAQRGGYAADMVPLICGELPFANIHEELANVLLQLDVALARG